MTSEQIRQKAREFHAVWMRDNIARLHRKNMTPSEFEIEFAAAFAESLLSGGAVGELCISCGQRIRPKFGPGDYSCTQCGLGMVEPCEHWKAHQARWKAFIEKRAKRLGVSVEEAEKIRGAEDEFEEDASDSGTPAEATPDPRIIMLYNLAHGWLLSGRTAMRECAEELRDVLKMDIHSADAAPPAASPQPTEAEKFGIEEPAGSITNRVCRHLWPLDAKTLSEQFPVIYELVQKELRAASGGQPAAIRPLIHNALTLAKKALWVVTLHAPDYDWNSDPIAITALIGSASQAIDSALAATAPDVGPLAIPGPAAKENLCSTK